mgnify:CR=1 FL=1
MDGEKEVGGDQMRNQMKLPETDVPAVDVKDFTQKLERDHNAEKAFDGDTYSAEDDFRRLGTSLKRVEYLLTRPRGRWWTLSQLSEETQSSEAGVSARVRDLRKPKNGSHRVESRRRGGGLWEYRIV